MCRERLEIAGIGRNDVIAVLGEHHERRVDHVARARAREQVARGPTQVLVERAHVDPGERLREQRLTRTAAAPRLPNDTA